MSIFAYNTTEFQAFQSFHHEPSWIILRGVFVLLTFHAIFPLGGSSSPVCYVVKHHVLMLLDRCNSCALRSNVSSTGVKCLERVYIDFATPILSVWIGREIEQAIINQVHVIDGDFSTNLRCRIVAVYDLFLVPWGKNKEQQWFGPLKHSFHILLCTSSLRQVRC